MATNLLVTGSHGGDDPHVESKHDALMHAAMLGRGGYILKTRNWTMKPTAKDANNITIPAWDLVVEGRQIYIAAPTDVNIQSGSQGQKRRDLIVARYALNSGTGVETVTLEAIKGKPSAATPADPGIETGSIIGGAIVSDLPLCRVNLDGITITSIDTLVNVMQPLEDVWDFLTQRSTTWRVPYSNNSISLTRVGDICFAGGNVKFNQSGENNYTQARETIPVGYRPAETSNVPIAVFGGNTTFILYGEHTGRVVMLGNPNNAYAGCTGVWRTSDPMPAA
ncbi:hypothetical protein [Bifidobacterium longum]|uniref:hypothetical protein n=1 Tax=Bifidobacterium longum TaxID=216816 RepID=UPI0010E43109|nr:hypothetical protein [Bifidobacterium longum]TCF04242.1 hypothetical protein MCC10080_1053 [Bifidobacterium longum subsp. longum]